MALGLWAQNNIRFIEPSKAMLALLLTPFVLISGVRLSSGLGTFLSPVQVRGDGTGSLVWVSRTARSNMAATRCMWLFLFKLINRN